MNISSIDSTMRLNASFASPSNKTSGTTPDPATMADKILQNGIRSKDTDGDGSLSSSELGGLSQDTFGTLDTDGDGKLNTDELKNAIQTHLEEMRKATEDGEAKTAKDLLDQLTATPEGQLMQALSPEKSSSASGGAMAV